MLIEPVVLVIHSTTGDSVYHMTSVSDREEAGVGVSTVITEERGRVYTAYRVVGGSRLIRNCTDILKSFYGLSRNEELIATFKNIPRIFLYLRDLTKIPLYSYKTPLLPVVGRKIRGHRLVRGKEARVARAYRTLKPPIPKAVEAYHRRDCKKTTTPCSCLGVLLEEHVLAKCKRLESAPAKFLAELSSPPLQVLYGASPGYAGIPSRVFQRH
eukprot:5822036-Pyramimonas_sp.AAC.1